MTITVWLKSFEFSRWPRKLTLKSRLGSAWYKKFQISSNSKTVLIFGICITFWAKKSPAPFPKSSGLPRYNQLADAQKSIILKCVGFKKFLAFWKEDHSREKTVPLPMHNSSWPWRNSTFLKISKNCWWGATTKNWKILANRKNNRWSLRIRQF